MASALPRAWLRIPAQLGVLLASIACFVAGGAFLLGALRMDAGTGALPGPAVFPALAAIGMMLASGALAVRSALTMRRDPGPPVELGQRTSAVALLALLAVAAGLESVGFPVAGFLLVAVLVRTFAGTGWARAALYAALFTGTSYLVFTRLLGVALPAGLLGG